jgi:catechol 2,3-dioxygenase-like lactoylglutathione lyase family enzyme
MPLQRLHHVNLRGSAALVRELREFYCTVLGLKDGPRPPFASTGAWLYADRLPLVHLVEHTGAQGSGAAVEQPRVVDHVAFGCRELDEFRRHLDGLGVAYSVSRVPVTGEVQLNLVDPCGMKIELIFEHG